MCTSVEVHVKMYLVNCRITTLVNGSKFLKVSLTFYRDNTFVETFPQILAIGPD